MAPFPQKILIRGGGGGGGGQSGQLPLRCHDATCEIGELLGKQVVWVLSEAGLKGLRHRDERGLEHADLVGA